MISTPRSNGSAQRAFYLPLTPVVDNRAGAGDPLDPLLDKLYRAAVEPDGWPAFLQNLREVIHADAMTLLAISTDGGVLQQICFDVGTDPKAEADYREYYAALDPWVEAGVLDAPVGAVGPSESFLSESELVRTEFYNDYYKPNGWHHGFGANLLEDSDGVMASVTGHRHKRRGNFGGADLALLTRLVPHLQRALRLRRDLDIMTVERDAGAQLLDRVSIGAILVDERGQVIRTNRIADAILAENDGLCCEGDGLAASTSGQTAELRRAIAGATDTSLGKGEHPGGRIRLQRPSGSRPYLIEVTPLDRQAELWGSTKALAAILVSDGNGGARADTNALSSFYSLTPAEAELTALLARGLSMDEVAVTRGITVNTARGQLKRIFAKTGTNRQVELVRLVLQGPAAFSRG